jgi:hypothetical protein
LNTRYFGKCGADILVRQKPAACHASDFMIHGDCLCPHAGEGARANEHNRYTALVASVFNFSDW